MPDNTTPPDALEQARLRGERLNLTTHRGCGHCGARLAVLGPSLRWCPHCGSVTRDAGVTTLLVPAGAEAEHRARNALHVAAVLLEEAGAEDHAEGDGDGFSRAEARLVAEQCREVYR